MLCLLFSFYHPRRRREGGDTVEMATVAWIPVADGIVLLPPPASVSPVLVTTTPGWGSFDMWVFADTLLC